MITGSVRGKCSALHFEHCRTCPPRFTNVSCPHIEQNPLRLCQLICALAWATIPASGPLSSPVAAVLASTKLQSPFSSNPRAARSFLEISTAKCAVSSSKPRKTALASTSSRRSSPMPSQPRPLRGPSDTRTSRSHSGRNLLVGSLALSAIHSGSRRSRSPLSKGLPEYTCEIFSCLLLIASSQIGTRYGAPY